MPEPLGKTSLGKSGISVGPVITGLWQIADQERDGRHFDLDRAAEELADYARSGFDTFDMADHYGSAEIVAGRAIRILEAEGRPAPTILTKWCPAPGTMDRATVRQGVETALERLGRERVDVMQFHWWRYESPEYLDALAHLTELRDEGLIGTIGLTNFDAAHLGIVLAQGIPVTSNQVCFSLLDRRACGDLADVAEANGVRLLAFGTLLGGFLSRRWLGAGELADIPDWSRMKYKRFIDTAGGWSRYQGLVESGAGAPTVGSGGISVAFAPVLSPAPMVAFPAPAPRTRRADFRHRALQWDHAPRTQATKANDIKDEVAARVSAAEAARLPPFLPRRARRPSSLSTP